MQIPGNYFKVHEKFIFYTTFLNMVTVVTYGVSQVQLTAIIINRLITFPKMFQI